jgi:hypothetical protein
VAGTSIKLPEVGVWLDAWLLLELVPVSIRTEVDCVVDWVVEVGRTAWKAATVIGPNVLKALEGLSAWRIYATNFLTYCAYQRLSS